MKPEKPEYKPTYHRRSNMAKLKTISAMAMKHKVMVAIDGQALKSLSLGEWQGPQRRGAFELQFALLGVFRAFPEETRADVYRRLYDEAKSAGAHLGPPEPVE